MEDPTRRPTPQGDERPLFTGRCGLLHYQSNSVVRHATAPALGGPWTVQGTVLAPRPGAWDSGGIHGPSVLRDATSGEFVLFYEATRRRRSRMAPGLF